MESGKAATIPNTEIRQMESIDENNISSSLIDSIDNPETDYPVCPVCSRPCNDKPTSVACDICNSWLHYKCENIKPEEETKLDDPGTSCTIPWLAKKEQTSQLVIIAVKRGILITLKLIALLHTFEYNILSSPLQVEKQISQPNSQSVKIPTANGDRVLSANRVTRQKQPYQPTQIGITQNTKTTEKAARTPTPNQSIIENLQNETDILQTSLSEKERLLNVKENQITKLETEVTRLKKQLSTNRSYSITLEGKTESYKDQIW